jgi:hypothetical protein
MTVMCLTAWLRDDDDGSGGGGGGLTGSAHGFSHSLVCVAMIVSALIGHFWRKEPSQQKHGEHALSGSLFLPRM